MDFCQNDLSELNSYKERLSTALRAAHICIFEVDLAQQRYTFFENSEAIFGVHGDKILNDISPYSKLNPAAYQKAVSNYFSHPDDAEVIDAAFKRVLSGKSASYQARMKAGSTHFTWCKIDVTPLFEGNVPIKMIGVITNISQMKAQMDYLRECAQLDSFTGLYVKKYSESLIKEILATKKEQKHALILIDLDDFKAINDHYGHRVGDEVLISTAEHLKHTFRKSDIISRFGGDEFMIFMENISSRQNLVDRITSLSHIMDNSYFVTKSIGVAIFPNDANNYEMLFDSADKALYRAKQLKKSYVLYSDQ